MNVIRPSQQTRHERIRAQAAWSFKSFRFLRSAVQIQVKISQGLFTWRIVHVDRVVHWVQHYKLPFYQYYVCINKDLLSKMRISFAYSESVNVIAWSTLPRPWCPSLPNDIINLAACVCVCDQPRRRILRAMTMTEIATANSFFYLHT